MLAWKLLCPLEDQPEAAVLTSLQAPANFQTARPRPEVHATACRSEQHQLRCCTGRLRTIYKAMLTPGHTGVQAVSAILSGAQNGQTCLQTKSGVPTTPLCLTLTVSLQ